MLGTWKLSLSLSLALSFIHHYLGWWTVYSVFTCLKHEQYFNNWPAHSFAGTKYTPSKSPNTHWQSHTLPLPCRKCWKWVTFEGMFVWKWSECQLLLLPAAFFLHSPVKMWYVNMWWGHALWSLPSRHLHTEKIRYSCKWFVSLWNQIVEERWRQDRRQMFYFCCGHFSSSLPTSWWCANGSQGQAGATGALILQRPVAGVGVICFGANSNCWKGW